MDCRFSSSFIALVSFISALVFSSAPAHGREPSLVTSRMAKTTLDTLDIERPDVKAFIADVSTRHNIAASDLESVLAQARILPEVTKLILPSVPDKSRSWVAYRARFIEPVRLRRGERFLRDHAATLARAEHDFGVPAEIITALLGVESIYGQHQGHFRVLDSLATLGFHFPTEAPRDRAPFFRAELEAFLVYVRHNKLAPETLRGSFAGAMGIPQFMPSSILQFAVDFDGDGTIDLHRSVSDAIGSVAHFLAQHGWQRDIVVDSPAKLNESIDPSAWIANDLMVRYTTHEWHALGVDVEGNIAPDLKLGLVDLASPDVLTEYRVGTVNFFAITRYNRSFFYAAAVADLADSLGKKAY